MADFEFLTGLVAAPHTPISANGSVNVAAIERQADILIANRVTGAFICGSTGESHSLTTAERIQVADAWKAAIRGRNLKLIVHVGHNSVNDAKALSAHAAEIKADATAAMAPCYYKPASIDDLVVFCDALAAESRALPFYFYDIPVLTGVNLPMADFLRKGSRLIPNLAGLKFTTSNMMSLQQCLDLEDGRFNILFGVDEMLLSALALGVRGAVGSTYNYAAPLYWKIMDAFKAGDMTRAQALQMKSVKLVEILCEYGVAQAGKALMASVGVECGPVRPPLRPLTAAQIETLTAQVTALDVLAEPLPVKPLAP